MAQHPTQRSDSVVITDARSGSSTDQKQRMQRYAITMGFRTACFIGVIFVPGALKWVLVAFAVFLPYVAVLFANQADTRTVAKRPAANVETEQLPQITTGGYETISGDVDDDPESDSDPARTHRAA